MLAWGRLLVKPSSVPVLKAEAKRRGLQPTALMADVVDRWWKAIVSSGWPRNSLAPRAYPGCTRPLYQRALGRTHAAIVTTYRLAAYVHDSGVRHTVVACIRERQQATQVLWRPSWSAPCRVKSTLNQDDPDPLLFGTGGWLDSWDGVWLSPSKLDEGGPEFAGYIAPPFFSWLMVLLLLGVGAWLRWVAKPAPAKT